MQKLAFKSSKLGFRSSKLATRADWSQCLVTVDQTVRGFASESAPFSTASATWDYPGQSGKTTVYDTALAQMNAAAWVPSICQAILKVDHSHGCANATHDHQNRYNDYLMVQGFRQFMKPEGVTGVVNAKMRIHNCGRVAQTEIRGPSNAHEIRCSMYRGAFVGVPAPLNNISLCLQFYVSEAISHQVILTIPQIIGLNGGAGVVAAGYGRWTYKINGYLEIDLPAPVITMLNDYVGVNLLMYWFPNQAYMGGYCPYCLNDYVLTGYQSSIAARAVIDVFTSHAQEPLLFVR